MYKLLLIKIFTLFLLALLATITARETTGEWVKFTMNIQTIFKKNRDSRVRRGVTYFWVKMSDLSCKCPKIKINKYNALFDIFLARKSNNLYTS